MAYRNIVVVGASAGGLEALVKIVGELPTNFPASLFIVVHTSLEAEGLLPQILRRAGPLPAFAVQGREVIREGRIYVAAPDRHLLIDRGIVYVTGGPKENGFRPAVDPLFRTASAAYGPRVIGVVLSGGLDDGTRGLLQIKRAGGVAVVQQPTDALVPGMPQSAVDNVSVDHLVAANEIGGLLAKLVRVEISEEDTAMAKRKTKPDPAERGTRGLEERTMPGPPSTFICPECGGALWELRDGKLISYRCHVGHIYTADGLVSRHSDKLDAALWTALRTLEDNAALRRHMAENMRDRGLREVAAKYEEQAALLEERADVIRNVVLKGAEPLPANGDTETKPIVAAAQGESGNGSGKRQRPRTA